MPASNRQSGLELKPIGIVRTAGESIPRHWTLSNVEGELHIRKEYRDGLQDILPGQRIVVIFHFDRSPDFSPHLLKQKPPHKDRQFGVFSICSPRRPNPIGMSVLEVLEVDGNVIRVKGLDMLDETPILDIKPYIPAEGA